MTPRKVVSGFSCLGWLSYLFQRVSLADVKTRLLFLSCVSFGNVFIGACLYRCASGQTWSRSLFTTYAVLFRAPGIGVTNEQSVVASLVLNTIFIWGLFLFSAFLGMISDEVKQQVSLLCCTAFCPTLPLSSTSHSLVDHGHGYSLTALQ